MKFSRLFKAAVALVLAVVMCGCDMLNVGQMENPASEITQESSSGTATRNYLPVKRTDGRKFKIAYVDIDPYNVTFKQLYYVIESLRDDGWISYDALPFDPEVDADTHALIDWLADNARSEYLEFDKTANYYTTVHTEEEIHQSLKEHIEVKKDIDIIWTMGTSPSRLVQTFNFDVPLLMYGVSDAIGSGLVVSAEDSGNDNYWAHVDTSAYTRQMQYYYDTFLFTNIGSVYNDEVVCAIPDYESAAKTNGFRLTKYQLVRADYEDEEQYYKDLADIYKKMVNEDKVEAYVLNTDVIPDAEKAREMLKVFYDADIPVFTQVGTNYVLEGAALMTVDTRDASMSGPFMANIIGSVLNGSKPGDLEQEFISSPYLTLNLDVADTIGYKPSFEMLIACEKVVCSDSGVTQ